MAVITDLSSTRIPNILILSGLIIGIFYRVICLGDRHYIAILLGIVIPVILFFPLFALRVMGAGDIKLFAVTGAFFTLGENLKCIVFAIFVGGIIALAKVLLYRNLKERIKYMFGYLKEIFQLSEDRFFYGVSYMDKNNAENIKKAGIRFSLPILIGAIVVMGGRV